VSLAIIEHVPSSTLDFRHFRFLKKPAAINPLIKKHNYDQSVVPKIVEVLNPTKLVEWLSKPETDVSAIIEHDDYILRECLNDAIPASINKIIEAHPDQAPEFVSRLDHRKLKDLLDMKETDIPTIIKHAELCDLSYVLNNFTLASRINEIITEYPDQIDKIASCLNANKLRELLSKPGRHTLKIIKHANPEALGGVLNSESSQGEISPDIRIAMYKKIYNGKLEDIETALGSAAGAGLQTIFERNANRVCDELEHTHEDIRNTVKAFVNEKLSKLRDIVRSRLMTGPSHK
jgi:hypothetical protein